MNSNSQSERRFLLAKALEAAMMIQGQGSDYAPLGLVRATLQHVLEHWEEEVKGGPHGQTEGVAGEVGSVDRGVHVTGSEVGSHDVRGGNGKRRQQGSTAQAATPQAYAGSDRRGGYIIRFAEARMRAEFAHTTKQVG